ncbi:MAG: hypothetical protein RLN67_02825 [Algiphilus sp.]
MLQRTAVARSLAVCEGVNGEGVDQCRLFASGQMMLCEMLLNTAVDGAWCRQQAPVGDIHRGLHLGELQQDMQPRGAHLVQAGHGQPKWTEWQQGVAAVDPVVGQAEAVNIEQYRQQRYGAAGAQYKCRRRGEKGAAQGQQAGSDPHCVH